MYSSTREDLVSCIGSGSCSTLSEAVGAGVVLEDIVDFDFDFAGDVVDDVSNISYILAGIYLVFGWFINISHLPHSQSTSTRFRSGQYSSFISQKERMSCKHGRKA